MSLYFADTSAFAKRYLPEIGSAWVRAWIDPSAGNTILISAISTVELVSLLARRQREGNVSAADFTRLKNDFLVHTNRDYRVIALSPGVLALARRLIEQYPLRTLDAIQLASARMAAQTIGPMPTFVTADQSLLAAATAEGFPTDDPNKHP